MQVVIEGIYNTWVCNLESDELDALAKVMLNARPVKSVYEDNDRLLVLQDDKRISLIGEIRLIGRHETILTQGAYDAIQAAKPQEG